MLINKVIFTGLHYLSQSLIAFKGVKNAENI